MPMPSPFSRCYVFELRHRLVPIVVLLASTVLITFGDSSAQASSSLSWSAPTPIDGPVDALSALSCPSVSLCVASDFGGNLLTSTDPTGGSTAWTSSREEGTSGGIPLFVKAISCPSVSLCIAIDSHGNVLTSSTPTGGAEAWQAANIAAAGELSAVSCSATPSPFCAVIGYEGDIWTSTDPTGGASAWQATTIDAGGEPIDVACPSVSLCVVADYHGNLLTSTNPAGGAGSWSGPIQVGGRSNGVPEPINGLSCPTTTFCAATDGYDYRDFDVFSTGDVMASTNPAGGASAWSAPADIANGLFAVFCQSSSFCLASDLDGTAYSATSPQGGAGAWSSSAIDRGNSLSAIACPTASLCVAIDGGGNVLTGTPAKEEEKPASKEPSSETPSGGGGTSSVAGNNPTTLGVSPPPASISGAQIAALLRQQLVPGGKAAKIGALLKHGGLTMPFKALAAGTLTVGWYMVPVGATLSKATKAKPVLVALGKLVFSGAGTGQVKIRLTRIGTRLLMHAKKLKVTVKGTFVANGRASISNVAWFSVRS